MIKTLKFSLFLLAGLFTLVSCGKEDPAQVKTFDAPANSFIVSQPRIYSFKPLKGKTQQSVGDIIYDV